MSVTMTLFSLPALLPALLYFTVTYCTVPWVTGIQAKEPRNASDSVAQRVYRQVTENTELESCLVTVQKEHFVSWNLWLPVML
jgi:hypothetical protein